MELSPEMNSVIVEWLKVQFNIYGNFLFGLLVGVLMVSIYHRFFGNRSIRSAYERLIKSKESEIESYKALISERLAGIKVDEKDQKFFKRVKKFFKLKITKQQQT